MDSKMSLRVLQIVLGVVLCLYSAQLVNEQMHAGHRSHAFWALVVLGSVEAVAALVFLFAIPIGGSVLLVTFAVAAIFHLLHGEPAELGVLLIYAAAVLAVISARRGVREPAHVR